MGKGGDYIVRTVSSTYAGPETQVPREWGRRKSPEEGAPARGRPNARERRAR